MASTPQPFLVQHRVVEHAADGQLGVVLDGIILEVLVAAVAVEQVLPLGIALANAPAQGQGHGGGLHVQRLVILDHADGVLDPHLIGADGDRLQEQLHPQPAQELLGLLEVGPAAIHRQRECLEPRRAVAAPQQRMVGEQEDRAAIDAAREADAERLPRRHPVQPAGDLVIGSRDIAGADLRQRRPAGRCVRE